MARIEWVREKLENWSRWCALRDGGALGYPKQSAFAALGGRGHRAEAVVPIDALQASDTDDAVASLKECHGHLHQVVFLIYGRSVPRHQVAQRLGKAESTIKRNLEDADAVLARWFMERQRARAERAGVLRHIPS